MSRLTATPAVSSMAYLRASDMTSRMPRSSMSRMVKTWMPDFLTILRSWASRSRAPTMTILPGSALGLKPSKIDEFGRAVTHDGGERHAVDVAGGRGIGRVHVAVGVEPEVADFFFVFAIMRGDASGDARGDGVIAAKNEREKTFAERFFDGGGEVLAGFRDFLKILGAFFADVHFFGLLHFEVADVFDGEAELLDGALEDLHREGRRDPCPRRGGFGRGPWVRR